jgi:glycosyltransferase involved in cell wall biosynthesis
METDSRLGVLHLISGLEFGGAEKMLLWAARHHDRKVIRLCVVSLMSGGSLAQDIRREGVEVWELDQRKGRLSPGALFKLLKVARYFAPRFIQGHLFHSNLLARLIALLVPGASALTTRHNETDSITRILLYALTSPLNAGTIVYSDAVRRHVTRDNLAGRPLKLVPYGIDLPEQVDDRSMVRAQLGVGSGAFVWITIGRLTRQKGYRILIDVFQRVIGSGGEGAILMIVGDGEERDTLKRQVSEGGLNGSVIFTGTRHDVPSLLSAADGYVLSSLWEGGPLVVLEAMAAGLPVVATRVGDVENMVREGVTGSVVEPSDLEGLSRAMKDVMSLGDDAVKWGREGHRRVSDMFNFETTQKRVEDFYMDFVNRPDGG